MADHGGGQVGPEGPTQRRAHRDTAIEPNQAHIGQLSKTGCGRRQPEPAVEHHKDRQAGVIGSEPGQASGVSGVRRLVPREGHHAVRVGHAPLRLGRRCVHRVRRFGASSADTDGPDVEATPARDPPRFGPSSTTSSKSSFSSVRRIAWAPTCTPASAAPSRNSRTSNVSVVSGMATFSSRPSADRPYQDSTPSSEKAAGLPPPRWTRITRGRFD